VRRTNGKRGGVRRKELLTILGPVTYERSMFQCPSCQATRYPEDEAPDDGPGRKSIHL
jgi:hypothetical protein